MFLAVNRKARRTLTIIKLSWEVCEEGEREKYKRNVGNIFDNSPGKESYRIEQPQTRVLRGRHVG